MVCLRVGKCEYSLPASWFVPLIVFSRATAFLSSSSSGIDICGVGLMRLPATKISFWWSVWGFSAWFRQLSKQPQIPFFLRVSALVGLDFWSARRLSLYLYRVASLFLITCLGFQYSGHMFFFPFRRARKISFWCAKQLQLHLNLLRSPPLKISLGVSPRFASA